MKNNFDSVSLYYDGLSRIVFGNKLNYSQKILLEYIRDGDKVLILGGGTGWILEELLKIKKVTQVDYVETSGKMLQKTKKRIPSEYNTVVRFIHGDEINISANNYDCVIACYFFDLFAEERLKKIIPIIGDSLKEEGRVLVADFYLSDLSPFYHKILLKLMYLFFRIIANVEAEYLCSFRTILKMEIGNVICVASRMNGFILSEVYTKEKE